VSAHKAVSLLLTAIGLAGGIAFFAAAQISPSKIVHLRNLSANHVWGKDHQAARRRWLASGLLFVAVPVADMAERLQTAGYLPVLLRLP
jgi:hypothetical protein